MNYHDLNNGLTLVEIKAARSSNVVKLIIDTQDIDKVLENGPWYWKDTKKPGQLALLVNQDYVPVTRFLMNATQSESVYNVSRNPFDLRKLNLMKTPKGKHQSAEFQKAVQEKYEENRESYKFIDEILGIGQVTSVEKLTIKKEKKQDQVSILNPVKTKVLKDLASNAIELQFEDGTRKEISIHEAQYLAKVLQCL